MNDVDNYIATFPIETQEKLQQIRKVIKTVAPEAKEMMAYRMPVYKINKYIVFFAGHKVHIGLYPLPSAIEKFEKDLSQYKRAKGSVQFPLDKPLPLELIEKIVKFRIEEDKVE